MEITNNKIKEMILNFRKENCTDRQIISIEEVEQVNSKRYEMKINVKDTNIKYENWIIWIDYNGNLDEIWKQYSNGTQLFTTKF